jgi:hypothetical protein
MHKFQDKTFVLISLASAPRGLFSIFLSNSYLELILIRDLVQIIWLLVWFFLLNLVQIFCLLVHLIWAERSCFWDLIELSSSWKSDSWWNWVWVFDWNNFYQVEPSWTKFDFAPLIWLTWLRMKHLDTNSYILFDGLLFYVHDLIA